LRCRVENPIDAFRQCLSFGDHTVKEYDRRYDRQYPKQYNPGR
jgi:hypothetical protein